MTDDQLTEQVHRVELRLERLDTKVEGLEKGLADLRAEFRPRLEGLDHHLARQAETWVVTVGMAGLGLRLTIDKFCV